MGEVNCKAVAADPHEQLVREHVLQARRQPDSSDHKIPTDSCEAFGIARSALRNDPIANVLELNGPASPLPVLTREAGNVPANDDERCQNCSTNPRVAVDEIAEALLGANVAEHDTVEELAFEGFWAQISMVKISKTQRSTYLSRG